MREKGAHLKFSSRNSLPQKITEVVVKSRLFQEKYCVRITLVLQITFEELSQGYYL